MLCNAVLCYAILFSAVCVCFITLSTIIASFDAFSFKTWYCFNTCFKSAIFFASAPNNRELSEEDNVLSYLAGEGLGKGQQVLLFCPSKLNCVQVCSALMETLCPPLRIVEARGAPNDRVEVQDVVGIGTVITMPIIHTASPAAPSATSTASSTSTTAVNASPASSSATIAENIMSSGRVFTSHQRYELSILEDASDYEKGNMDYQFLNSDKNTARTNNFNNSSNDNNNKYSNNINTINNSKIMLRKKILRDRLACITGILDLNPHADPSLFTFIACGIAYHHAGLSFQERGAVEQAFKSGEKCDTIFN